MPKQSNPRRDIESRLQKMQKELQDLKRCSRYSRSRERFKNMSPARDFCRSRSRSRSNNSTVRQRRFMRIASSDSSDSDRRDHDYGADNTDDGVGIASEGR